MTLRELRLSKQLTQREAAEMCSVSLRSYNSFENEPSKTESIKYRYMCSILEEYNRIDETHGILTIEEIKKMLKSIFEEYNIDYCYLFGSYAKGKATQTSDVDLLIASDITGIKFFGMTDKIRTVLCKNVDVLDLNQLKDNAQLLNEILKDGVKIYG